MLGAPLTATTRTRPALPRPGRTRRRAAGDTKHAKFFQFQEIRQLRNNRRPIEQFAPGHETRIGNSRPVWRNNSHPQSAGGVMGNCAIKRELGHVTNMTGFHLRSAFAERDPFAVLSNGMFLVPQRSHWHITNRYNVRQREIRGSTTARIRAHN